MSPWICCSRLQLAAPTGRSPFPSLSLSEGLGGGKGEGLSSSKPSSTGACTARSCVNSGPSPTRFPNRVGAYMDLHFSFQFVVSCVVSVCVKVWTDTRELVG